MQHDCGTMPLAGTPRAQERGRQAWFSGRSAERSVARHLAGLGYVLLAERWRGQGGEIDLVLRQGETFVFVEVKKARSFDKALCSLREAQMLRIHAAASEYLGQTARGQLSEVRFDLALVNETGRIRVIENAFGHL